MSWAYLRQSLLGRKKATKDPHQLAVLLSRLKCTRNADDEGLSKSRGKEQSRQLKVSEEYYRQLRVIKTPPD